MLNIISVVTQSHVIIITCISDKTMELLVSSYVTRILFSTWIALTMCFGEIRMKNEDFVASLGLVGCFEENLDFRGFPYSITNSVGSLTAELCKEACMHRFFRYVSHLFLFCMTV
jgi:hypothetical protein